MPASVKASVGDINGRAKVTTLLPPDFMDVTFEKMKWIRISDQYNL